MRCAMLLTSITLLFAAVGRSSAAGFAITINDLSADAVEPCDCDLYE